MNIFKRNVTFKNIIYNNITVDEPLDPLVLLLGLEADEVHAPLPAVVTRVEPVPLGVPEHRESS